VLTVVRAAPIMHAARPASLATAAVQVAAVTAPVHKRKAGSSGDTGTSHDSAAKEHDAQQIAEHHNPSSNDNQSKDSQSNGSQSNDNQSNGNQSNGDGEHTATIASRHNTEHTSSSDHFGKGSDTHPTDSQSTDSQSSDSQSNDSQPSDSQSADPQRPEQSATATSANLTLSPLPAVPVVVDP
jgi:hypothetical protein